MNKAILFDAEDAVILEKYTWYINYRGYVEAYYKQSKGSYGRKLMHREIMGAVGDKLVDHINGNKLDNRKENLRFCTSAENNRNRQKSKNRRFKGVDESGGAFTARICINAEKKHLGTWTTAELAAKAYDRAARTLFKEFAKTNFPNIWSPVEALELKAHLAGVATKIVELFPKEYRESIKNKFFFAGGCVFNWVAGEMINDYDIFLEDEEAVVLFQLALTPLAKVVSANALTLDIPGIPATVQVVTRFTGPTERIFKDFDYEMTKSFYHPGREELSYPEDIILKKQLVYTGEKDEFTLNTLKRMAKFVSRGWTPTNDTIINLHRAIQNRPHIDVPEERQLQVIGFYGSSFK